MCDIYLFSNCSFPNTFPPTVTVGKKKNQNTNNKITSSILYKKKQEQDL